MASSQSHSEKEGTLVQWQGGLEGSKEAQALF